MNNIDQKSTLLQWKMVQLWMLAILVLLLLVLSIGVMAKAEGKSTRSSASEWFKVADNTYVFRYKFYYTMFVNTTKGVIAFDPLSNNAAEDYAKAIREAVPEAKLNSIVYTHWHTDHSTGANVLRREFGKDIPILAHANTLARLKRLKDSDVPLPTKVVSNDGMTIADKKNPIELKYLGHAHTNSMLIAFLPKQKLVFGVDFVNHDSMGWRDLPGVDVDNLITMQKKLLELDFETITFGHGRPGGRDVVKRQIAYYEALVDETSKAINKGMSEDQAAEVITLERYKDWANYDYWFTLNVRGVYRFVKEKSANKGT